MHGMLGFEISGLRLNRHAQTYQRPIGLELAFAPLALLRCPLLPPALRQRFET